MEGKGKTIKKGLVALLLFAFSSASILIYRCEPSSVYKGQQVLLTGWVLSNQNVMSALWKAEPRSEGFWKEEVELKVPHVEGTTYKGRFYWAYLVKKAVLFPLREGILTVKGGKVEVELEGGAVVLLEGGQCRVRVKKLPEGVDVVGKLDLRSELERRGGELLLRVVVEGEANFKLLPWPVLKGQTPSLELLKSSSKYKVYFEGGRLRGRKFFTYLVQPLRPGKLTLPVLSYRVFDPEREKVYVISTRPLEVEIEGMAVQQEPAPLRKELKGPPLLLLDSPLFIAFSVILLLSSGGVAAWRRSERLRERFAGWFKSRKACRLVCRLASGTEEFSLALLKRAVLQCFSAGSPEQLFQRLKRAVQKESWMRWWQEADMMEFSPYSKEPEKIRQLARRACELLRER